MPIQIKIAILLLFRFKSDCIVIKSIGKYLVFNRDTRRTHNLFIFQIKDSLKIVFNNYSSTTSNPFLFNSIKLYSCNRSRNKIF